jgi:hypothetical protein
MNVQRFIGQARLNSFRPKILENSDGGRHFQPSLIFEGKVGSPWRPHTQAGSVLACKYEIRVKVNKLVVDSNRFALCLLTVTYLHPNLIFAGKFRSPWRPLLCMIFEGNFRGRPLLEQAVIGSDKWAPWPLTITFTLVGYLRARLGVLRGPRTRAGSVLSWTYKIRVEVNTLVVDNDRFALCLLTVNFILVCNLRPSLGVLGGPYSVWYLWASLGGGPYSSRLWPCLQTWD